MNSLLFQSILQERTTKEQKKGKNPKHNSQHTAREMRFGDFRRAAYICVPCARIHLYVCIWDI